MTPLLELKLRNERDAIAARQATRQLSRLLGFEHHDQIRITTAVSELVRAASGENASDALVEFLVTQGGPAQRLVLRVTGENLAGDSNGAGLQMRGDGKLGAQRLLQRFDDPDAGPETVTLARELPKGADAVDEQRATEIRVEIERLTSVVSESYLAELKQQNRELSSTLVELERKQDELTRLNAELADTNRGVMALYAELDERANHLRRADEIKTKFLSNMSHEFRTPLSSIRTLSKLLLDQTDGLLNAEQMRQVQLIHGAAADMFELVSDLLDLAKVEAGKSAVNLGQFTVASLFGVLRGMMRPLLRTPSVSLEFDESADVPPVVGDEGKVAQVLRNFLSNAVKFTETGYIRVSAEHVAGGGRLPGSAEISFADSVVFCVTDTGIGISRGDQAFIFDEFTQVTHELQRTVRGTGLGLPLCQKLAGLMGGRVWVESELGVGSRFYLLIPRFYRPSEPRPAALGESSRSREAARPKLPLLVVSNTDSHRRYLEAVFEGSVLSPVCVEASGVGEDYLKALRPEAAVVDVSTAKPVSVGTVNLISEAGIPVLLTSEDAAHSSGAAIPLDEGVVRAAYAEILRASVGHVLLVDDDDRFRTVLLKLVGPYSSRATATGDPRAALELLQDGGADCAVLDLMMPDLDGLTLAALLRRNAATAELPLLACSSKALTLDDRRLLLELRVPFLSKAHLDQDSLARGLIEARASSTSFHIEHLESDAGTAR